MLTLLLSVMVLILLLFLLLCLPVRYSAHFARRQNTNVSLVVSWARLVTASFSLGEGLVFRVLGLRLRAKGGKSEASKDKPRQKKKKAQWRRSDLDLRLLWEVVRRVLAHVKPERVEGDLCFGFEDPYYTGMVGALLYTWPGLARAKFTPVYDEEVLEGWFLIQGRVIPMALLLIALRGYAPILIGNIKTKFGRRERKVEKHV